MMADLVLFEVLRGFRDEQDFNAARRTLAALPVVEIGGEDEAFAPRNSIAIFDRGG